MTNFPKKTRYGFYYFPDTSHYRENDLNVWIPELHELGASWLTLLAPADQAIPGTFIRQIINEGIEPIIHIPLPITNQGNSDITSVIFEAYLESGVNYIALYDRPNSLKNWSSSNWVQKNLVERFLDIFIPIAEKIIETNLIPVFPPLEPGGDYWDTAFLFSALNGLQRRDRHDLLDRLVLSAYAWSGNRSPNWGAGGPERWPCSRPYSNIQNSEDHLGFRIFDWYLAIAEATLGKSLPIILLGAGSRIGDQIDPSSPAVDVHAHTWQNMTILQLLANNARDYDPVPSEVLACNFWLLSAEKNDPEVNNAWYKPDRKQLPIVTQLKEWVANEAVNPPVPLKSVSSKIPKDYGSHPISHYLLLPTFKRGVHDLKLEAIKPFINKYQPTIGFSPIEATHAKKVTVVGEVLNVPEDIIDCLLAAGCIVELISGDGMNIATDHVSHSSK